MGQVVLGSGFNGSELKGKLDEGSLGLLTPEPLGEGGPHLHYFFWVTTPWP